ncbi:MAG: hypothetical protein IT160_15580 [Bryobacterales bacterium]|nr:hypothetical protein [Bryobacterales bacterium]
MMLRRLLCGIWLALGAMPAMAAVRVDFPQVADSRIDYGVEQLKKAASAASRLRVRVTLDPPMTTGTAESYRLRVDGDAVSIIGHDAAGAMYGMLDLAQRLKGGRTLPAELDVTEKPSLSLRGTCILLMKLGTYDYAITPDGFPFFYDKTLWREYLDFLAENRFNYIAFWNGHPFDYFVKLAKYPEAQRGMEAGLLERNHQMLMWLGQEAKKRNIWLMFQFYNIHTSVYFQKAHQLPAWNPKPTPLLADYTAYCIERFVAEFPAVGLYICPGEALKLEYTDSWINDVIFPAVKRSGKNPPIMIRAWGIDLDHMRKVAGNYRPLYTERKFNVEMIASTEIDPENADWARVTGNHVVNIHCVGNLEPFRWSPPAYIQKIVRNSLRVGATGLHLYPRKAWRWPYGCDRLPQPELQWRRDWMWFEAWGRYAWNADRAPKDEQEFWIGRLAVQYGAAAAPHVLAYHENIADVLPAIQRLIWLGNDNHTVVSAGILLDQLERAGGVPFLPLPELVRIPEWLEGLRNGTHFDRQTPEDLMAAKLAEADRASREAAAAAAAATSSGADARALATDAQAVALVARFYLDKLRAARARARGDQGGFVAQMRSSLDDFRQLTKLTASTYESLSDVPAWNPVQFKPDICPYHWSDILPYMEREFARISKAR